MASKLVFYTYLKRILKKAKGILTITLFALAFLFGNGNGFPTRTGSHPLDYAPLSEPSIVSRRVDDLLDAFRRRNEVPEGVFSIGDDAVDASDFGNPAKYWQRGIDDDVVDVGRNESPKNARDSNLAVDDDDVKFQALWAELSRQSAEIGELTAKVIHDDREIRQLNEKLLRDDGDIVELRVVVCRLLAALCHSQGSPCMECPWKDLPTEAPATTTEPATKTTTTITTSASPSTSTSETPTTPEARTTAPDPQTTTAAPTTTTSPTTTPTTTIVTYSTTTQPPSTTSASSSSSSTSSTDPATTTSAPTQTTSVEPSSSTVVSTTNAPSVTTTGANMTTTATTSEATTATTSEATTATTMITTVTTMSTTPKPTPDPKAKCDDPKPPENGYIVGNETTLGSHVEIKCKEGFTLVGVPMMECTALWSDETRSFSYNWAPPMSAVCKANAGYVSKGKGATKAKTEPGRKRRNVEKRAEVDNTKVRKRRSVETNEICNQPRVVGPCRAAFPRHFFNPESGMCEPFIFGGCMGNDNNFVTIEKCKMTCGS